MYSNMINLLCSYRLRVLDRSLEATSSFMSILPQPIERSLYKDIRASLTLSPCIIYKIKDLYRLGGSVYKNILEVRDDICRNRYLQR